MNIDEQFEIEWEDHIKSLENDFNSRHKSWFGKWFYRPDHHIKYTPIYRLQKSTAQLFFAKGCLFAQLVVNNEMKETNKTVLEIARGRKK